MPRLQRRTRNTRSMRHRQDVRNHSENSSMEASSASEDTFIKKQRGIKTISTKHTRLQRRRRDLTSPNNDSSEDTTNPAPLAPLGNNTGLDWDWVATLDQNPEGKDYFPPCYNPFGTDYFLGDEIEKPAVVDANDLPQFTTWVLARVRQLKISNAMIKMITDQNLRTKWVICPRMYLKSHRHTYRDINLTLGAPGNHEAAYAATAGIILPPDRACTSCKENRGVFQQCIVLPGYLHGACAGCHYNAGGKKCSHRTDANKRAKLQTVPISVPTSHQPKGHAQFAKESLLHIIQDPGSLTPKDLYEGLVAMSKHITTRFDEIDRKLQELKEMVQP